MRDDLSEAGWLFAVFLALQRRQAPVLFRALAPITAGHAASIAVVAVPVLLLQSTLASGPLRLVTAGLLLGFGVYKLLTRLRHPRWVGLKVGYRDLAWWSFLGGWPLRPLRPAGRPGALYP